MLPTYKGSIRLFRLLGINVFLHWSWFLYAVFRIQLRAGYYSSYAWCAVEYLGLFAMVVMHEFGHALACRSVGGKADQIVLWPLGGVAFVDPPPRPGATLWSLAAGPLVNVILLPILSVAWMLARHANLEATMPNLFRLTFDLWLINVILLCFNMLPIYPLDGGQILRSLLWYWVGRAKSLMIATTIGIVSVVLLTVYAIQTRWAADSQDKIWLGVIAAFALMQCWNGLKYARILARLEAAPRHPGVVCPNCHSAPPAGDFWLCGRCRQPFDIFGTQGICPSCGATIGGVRCMECGESNAVGAFQGK